MTSSKQYFLAVEEIKNCTSFIESAIFKKINLPILQKFLDAHDKVGTTWKVISEKDTNGYTMLYKAVLAANGPVVKAILAAADRLGRAWKIITIDINGSTALKYANFPDARAEGINTMIMQYKPTNL